MLFHVSKGEASHAIDWQILRNGSLTLYACLKANDRASNRLSTRLRLQRIILFRNR